MLRSCSCVTLAVECGVKLPTLSLEHTGMTQRTVELILNISFNKINPMQSNPIDFYSSSSQSKWQTLYPCQIQSCSCLITISLKAVSGNQSVHLSFFHYETIVVLSALTSHILVHDLIQVWTLNGSLWEYFQRPNPSELKQCSCFCFKNISYPYNFNATNR